MGVNLDTSMTRKYMYFYNSYIKSFNITFFILSFKALNVTLCVVILC